MIADAAIDMDRDATATRPAPRVDTAPARVLWISTAAFSLLFAVWLMFGVLAKPIRAELKLSANDLYWLGSAAVLAGSLLRLPFGILAERIGGRRLMIAMLLWTALPCALVGWASSFNQLLVLALLFGIAGNSFSVGIAWNAACSPPERKGFALGVFGAGNVGASVTKLFGPALIAGIPAAGLLGGMIPGGWRSIPVFYAISLVAMAGLVVAATPSAEPLPGRGRPMAQMLAPLRDARVWRFGLYYVVVFGAYVACSLWLPSFFQDAYGCTLGTAALITAAFIFPASLLRPLGGWLSDRYGPRPVTYASFIGMLVLCIPLTFSGPRDLHLGLAWVSALVIGVGVCMGLGKASVYRYIPDYYPGDVGAVGGLVGSLGALGGVVLMPVFGWIEAHGMRTSAFAALSLLIGFCLLWLQIVVVSIRQERERRERQAAEELAYAEAMRSEDERVSALRSGS